ncbi:MAG: ABC transporter ATP-binding protein [Planctomycetes bacterium]|nr:ABC transporter ATP-binding protein [Planctomycetota bacterium]
MSAPENNHGLWRLLSHVRPYRGTVLFILFLLVVYSGANSLRIATIGLVIDGIVSPGDREERGRVSSFVEDQVLPVIPGDIQLPSETVSSLALESVTISGIPAERDEAGLVQVREGLIESAVLVGGGQLSTTSSGESVLLRFRAEGKLDWIADARGDAYRRVEVPGPVDLEIVAGSPGSGGSNLLWICAAFLAVISLAVAFSGFYRVIMGQEVRIRVIIDIRKKLFGKLSTQSLDFYESRTHGDVISRTVGDVNTLSSSIQLLFGDFLQSPLTILFSLALAFFASWKLTLLTIPFLILLTIPVFRQARKVRKGTKGALSHVGETTEGLSQLMSGIRVVKTFGLEERRQQQFGETSEALQKAQIRTEIARAKGRSFVEGLYNLLSAAVIGFGGWFLLNDLVDISFGDFTIFLAAIVSCYTPIKNVAKIITTLAESTAATDRIFDLIDSPVSMQDEPGANEFTGFSDKIEFRDVNYRYPGQEEQAVEGISFVIRQGEKVALVGPSGAGKSTLFDLLARLREQDSGEILFDGVDSKSVTRSSLLAHMAYVGQEPFLFNTTVEDNIRGADQNAAADQVKAAAKAAAIHEDIMALPDGYQTVLGERGDRLSGGQRQRLTIARAFLRDAPILLLDEATAALDSESEQLVQSALERLMKDRTVLVIAHRLATIQDSNRVLVLESGRIVEQGSDQELRAQGGLYSRLRDLQELGVAEKGQ